MPSSTRQGPRGKTIKQDQSDATRQRLLAAAKKLFAEHGYGAVSVTEIAKEAGVTHAMINAYFYSKAGLAFALLNQNNQQIEKARALDLDGLDLKSALAKIVEIFVTPAVSNPELLSVVQSYFWQWPRELEPQSREQIANGLDVVRSALEKAITEGELRPDMDMDLVLNTIAAIYHLGLRPAIYDDWSAEQCIESILKQIDLLLQGQRTPREIGGG